MKKYLAIFFRGLVTFNVCFRLVLSDATLEETIKNDPNLSEFYSLLEKSEAANASLFYRCATVFVPTNKAFQNFESSLHVDVLISYHLVTVDKTTDQLKNGQALPTHLEGNPFVWISVNHRNEVYVNDAKIIIEKSNVQCINKKKKKQVMHVIDKVLEPSVSSDSATDFDYNPSAFQLLSFNFRSDSGVVKYKVRTFRQRVFLAKRMDLYKAKEGCTFFVPVDEGLDSESRKNKITDKVVDAHVVPNEVLFTPAIPLGKEYKTLAFIDNIKVTVSFVQEHDGNHTKLFVQSHTIIGDNEHPKGIVVAKILHGNIPVRNGVIHLISYPLVVVDTSVTEFLKKRNDGPLYRFYRLIMDFGGDFVERISKHSDITLFAPNNLAWQEKYISQFTKDSKSIKEILDIHLVEKRLPMEKIIKCMEKQVYMTATSDGVRTILFDALKDSENKAVMTLEGGGTNSTILQPDITLQNGVVHIINSVLGIPLQNVREKLGSHAHLQKTFVMGEVTKFNTQLNGTHAMFTYFVPRDYAWKKAEIMHPSAIKKLFMKKFGYHTRQILGRHLVIHEKAFTMAHLASLSNETLTLPSLRDNLQIKVKEIEKAVHDHSQQNCMVPPRKGYVIDWRGESIPVFRPDVKCSNGIIHVIDRVMLRDRDVRINGNSKIQSSSLLILLGLIILPKLYEN